MVSMLTKTHVLARYGWSRSVLDQLLGEPDLRKKVHGRTNLSALYFESRVVTAEHSDVFKSLQANLAIRKASAAKTVLTKTNKLLAAVDAMKVDVTFMPLHDVQRLAIDSYNGHNAVSQNDASHKSDAAFLTRIAANFIRHELTEYGYALADVAGKTGITKAIDGIRQKVYAAIATAYPVFSSECQRQCVARREHHA